MKRGELRLEHGHSLPRPGSAHEGKAQREIREVCDVGAPVLEGGMIVCLNSRVEGCLFRHGARRALVFPHTKGCVYPAAAGLSTPSLLAAASRALRPQSLPAPRGPFEQATRTSVELLFILCKQRMTTPERPEQASFSFARLVELLRKREVPGAERREAERQAEFEARYCESSTEYCSTETNEASEQEL